MSENAAILRLTEYLNQTRRQAEHSIDLLNQKLKELEQELETNAGNHKTEQKYIQEMKGLIRQHDEWVAQRASSQEGLTEMDAKQYSSS